MISKFEQAGKAKVSIERIGPLRGFQRLCIQVYKMLENYKEKLENNQILPDVDRSPQKATIMSLDAMKLTDRQAVRNRAQKTIENDYITIPRDQEAKEFHSEANAKAYKDQGAANLNPQLESQPGTRTMMRDLTIFSHSDSMNSTGRHKQKKPSNWTVPFQINKPVFPDNDLERELKYRDRDPRKDLKYFSIDESSSLISKDLTRLNFRRKEEPIKKSTFEEQGNRIMASKYGTSSSTQNLNAARSEGPVRLPRDDREEMMRKIMKEAEAQFRMPTGSKKKVDDAFANLLKSSKL